MTTSRAITTLSRIVDISF